MQYSPKLKQAAEEIKKILERHDIAGSIVIHTPGHSEYVSKLDTSYSCAYFEGDMIRIRAKLQEDFNGDKELWTQRVQDTVNMIHHLGNTSRNVSLSFFALEDKLKETVKIDYYGGGHSSHTTQNN